MLGFALSGADAGNYVLASSTLTATADITPETLTGDVYAFIFGQQGLMAGIGLQGTKITKLNR